MEEKKTRRNKRILIVSAMLVLLLGILCFGGVTFAKYLTEKKVTTDQATVAKWGYVITADASKLYGDAYAKGSNENSKVTDVKNGAVSILSADKKVVAPGSTGELSITIKGTAEVSSKITIAKDTTVTVADVSFKYGDGENDVYTPIKWTLKKNGTLVGTANDTLDNCLKALESTATNRAGTAINDTYTLSWTWAFQNTEENANIYDTILGDAAANMSDEDWAEYHAGYDKTNAKTTINFALIVTVEQTQEDVEPATGA